VAIKRDSEWTLRWNLGSVVGALARSLKEASGDRASFLARELVSALALQNPASLNDVVDLDMISGGRLSGDPTLWTACAAMTDDSFEYPVGLSDILLLTERGEKTALARTLNIHCVDCFGGFAAPENPAVARKVLEILSEDHGNDLGACTTCTEWEKRLLDSYLQNPS
jgi:hypothetical protein